MIGRSGSITTTGAGAPAVIAASKGGLGANASANTSTYYGSNGGNGGAVNFTNAGTITTIGDQSSAVILQSIGRAGGKGSGGAWTSAAHGADGGMGGIITATNTGTISTQGNYSFGIVAQSVGGAGGQGARSTFGSGGNGGTSGKGGDVTIDNAGNITTIGKGSAAIAAQSIGGGNALSATWLTVPSVGQNTQDADSSNAGGSGGVFFWSSGGVGGAAGPAGTVKVNLKEDRTISTAGDMAYGVLMQSIGGGGGRGGNVSSYGIGLSVALGGSGGDGGDGGTVNFDSYARTGNQWSGYDWHGLIETSGDNATAVLGQSIGGGGGTGGDAAASSIGLGLSAAVAVGGKGGGGGNGGTVSLQNRYAITTWGENAGGLDGISIGGGGGTAGDASAYSVALPLVTPSGQQLPSISISAAVGGAGGNGGNGGTVTINNVNNTVTTYGAGSIGLASQSIGGGGGNAGSALAEALSVSAPGSVAVSVAASVGGSGGKGGKGGYAEVRNTGTVRTFGNDATGILAQSVGGGGGNAGSASSSANAVSLRNSVVYTLSVGGSGGSGGSGGDVLVQHLVDTASGLYHYGASVATLGDRSAAIVAQSIGGGGGNGGAVSSSATTNIGLGNGLNGLAQQYVLGKSLTGTTSIGGSGGDGGNGGKVEIVTNAGSTLSTGGAQSAGIFAQSIGGGGGTGGGGSEKVTGTAALKLSIGGSGGAGGTGGAVTITQRGSITTLGDASHGIFAQSVGGGGGEGGNFTAAASTVPDTIAQLTKTIKKNVKGIDKALKKINANPGTKEYLDKLIDTLKLPEFADAIRNSDLYKQLSALNAFIKEQNKSGVKFPSVSLTLSLGGAGGSGNAGGIIDIGNSGTISTAGNAAHGIFAQSIGGGGGDGGTAYGSGTSKLNLLGTLGGSGGSGGVGGGVAVNNTGAITTAGEASYGIFSQSVGGGGGTGVGALSSQNKAKSVTLNFTLGGTGGSGNAGGAVTVTNSGALATSGAEAHGLVAQSVGGGGGAFAMNPETSKDAQASASDAVPLDTLKAFLKLFGLEQVPDAAPVDPNAAKTSITSGSFTLGGSGGTGGNGGAVKVVQSGTISTSGEAAFGIFAQSIGGGGGLSNAAGSPGGVKFSASMGGSGGAAGNGGSVTLDLTGAGGKPSQITTSGNASTAVFAQSVGGGGGYGGSGVLMGWTVPIIGGSGGSSGNGGAISISGGVAGTDITTTGTFAHGIWAQSLGGGGGATRTVLNITAPVDAIKLAGDADNKLYDYGQDDKIGDILDSVPQEYRSIVAALGLDKTVRDVQDWLSSVWQDSMSIRKGSSGQGGTININIANGNISATGADSFGILAQSGFQKVDGRLDPSKRGGNITVNYTGTIVGGSGNGAAIGIDGGNTNQITIGAGSTLSALSGKAIVASFGKDTVTNHGTVVGDIDLNVGGVYGNENAFTNAADGTYRSAGAGTINLGASGGALWYSSAFTNLGTLDVGGVGQIATASVTRGKLDLGGVLLADVTSVAPANSPSSDLLTADYLLVDGVAIKPYAVNGLLPGNFTVVTTANMLFGGVPATAGASPVSPISWSVAQTGNSLVISPSAAFLAKAQSLTSRALTKTERSMLQSAQNAWDSSNAGMAGFFAQAANLTTKQQFKALVNSASASESNNQPAVGQSFQSLDSLNASLSCPAFEGDGLRIHEGECVWSRVVGSRMARFGGSDGEGFNQSGMSYRVGAQWEVAPDWYLGATAAYNMSWLQASSGLSSTNGTGGDVSVALKHQMGPLLLAASLQAGYGTYETNNTLVVGTQQGAASNDTDLWTAGLKLRAAYEFAFQTWYVRPYVDVNVLHLSMPGYTFAANGMSVSSGSIDHWSGVLQPVLEVGSRVNVGDGAWVRPYVGVGGMFVAGNSINTTSTFSYGGTQGISYETSNEMPNALLDVGGGVQFMNRDGYEVRGQYRAQLANDFVGQELSLRLSMKF
ncbi:autotransporter outer membrane beta-barrel domain-containing protein [Segnochrobactrum spirostomi]|uniref:Autotransporter outer membrane beta-barrel domain-containing protein n=1 Tax=Segnochrobactrum spirostomi TaxID=2608987 RepID=A0A6A7YB74_9HYPH|nr:autotransporter outer membrane beta-barrel domain-containing protein [Segnochrobactrum spirostomi]MQT14669.1 autotransporter outer membrane beta-barrel domain-containing protein [Segnochrobactrum spirostomi]